MYTGEEHENNLSELIKVLNVEGVDQAKVSLIIQGLRDNYNEVNTTLADNTKNIENINTLNEGLRSANMSLLSKLGTSITDLNNRNKEEFKNQNKQEEQQETSMTTDDLIKNFI